MHARSASVSGTSTRLSANVLSLENASISESEKTTFYHGVTGIVRAFMNSVSIQAHPEELADVLSNCVSNLMIVHFDIKGSIATAYLYRLEDRLREHDLAPVVFIETQPTTGTKLKVSIDMRAGRDQARRRAAVSSDSLGERSQPRWLLLAVQIQLAFILIVVAYFIYSKVDLSLLDKMWSLPATPIPRVSSEQ